VILSRLPGSASHFIRDFGKECVHRCLVLSLELIHDVFGITGQHKGCHVVNLAEHYSSWVIARATNFPHGALMITDVEELQSFCRGGEMSLSQVQDSHHLKNKFCLGDYFTWPVKIKCEGKIQLSSKK